jgi:hypothetical protein
MTFRVRSRARLNLTTACSNCSGPSASGRYCESGDQPAGAAENLRVSEPSDPAETEAHSVSDRVAAREAVQHSVARVSCGSHRERPAIWILWNLTSNASNLRWSRSRGAASNPG